MKRFELIAIDMDGTLLNSRTEITPRVRDSIRSAVEKGVFVSLATGRTFGSAAYYSRSLDLNLPLITYNGALIKESENGLVHLDRRIPLDIAQQIAAYITSHGLYLKVYSNEKMYVAEATDETISFAFRHKLEYEAVGNLETSIKEPPNMMVIVDSQDAIDRIYPELQNRWGSSALFIRSFPRVLDIVNINTGKKEALKYLSEKLNVPSQKVLAIGNELNDLDMVVWAGLGVAMGNSSKVLINSADVVTVDNDHDGVARIIEEYVL